jgi:hypothetical protein
MKHSCILFTQEGENSQPIHRSSFIHHRYLRQSLFTFLALAAILFDASPVEAQVTIGGQATPKAGAILDLNSTNKGGLLLSNVALEKLSHIPGGNQLTGIASEQDENLVLTGTVVYNTADIGVDICPGVYVWDGTKWNRVGEPCQGVAIPADIICDNGVMVPSVRFMAYNLGADPQYDTPKKQMEYLATHPFSATDAHVYGGLYQWGRRDSEHAVNAANFTRYEGTENAWLQTSPNSTPVDATGQPTGDAAGKFIYNNSGGSSWTWNPNFYYLWGSPYGGTVDNKGGVLYNGAYYQNTDWVYPSNNPCPAGWRVPTQDEWERLANYDCQPIASINVLISNTTPDGKATNTGLTWVPVVCGSGQCKPDSTWTENVTAAGYAIYRTAVWAAAADYQSGSIGAKSLHEADAPEPLLFLPAAGCRWPNNSYSNIGNQGRYWSCLDMGGGRLSYYLNLSGLYVGDGVAIPPYGYSVRCVAAK